MFVNCQLPLGLHCANATRSTGYSYRKISLRFPRKNELRDFATEFRGRETLLEVTSAAPDSYYCGNAVLDMTFTIVTSVALIEPFASMSVRKFKVVIAWPVLVLV